jgi:hypothetical protein
MSLKLNLYTVYTIFAACEIYIENKRGRKKTESEKIKGYDTNILLLLITIRLFHP